MKRAEIRGVKGRSVRVAVVAIARGRVVWEVRSRHGERPGGVLGDMVSVMA